MRDSHVFPAITDIEDFLQAMMNWYFSWLAGSNSSTVGVGSLSRTRKLVRRYEAGL